MTDDRAAEPASRRAALAAGAATVAALVPAAGSARKRRPSPPEAFAVARVVELGVVQNGFDAYWEVTIDGSFWHPASNDAGNVGGVAYIDASEPPAAVRQWVAKWVQSVASTNLEDQGHIVALDRIAVTLL